MNVPRMEKMREHRLKKKKKKKFIHFIFKNLNKVKLNFDF